MSHLSSPLSLWSCTIISQNQEATPRILTLKPSCHFGYSLSLAKFPSAVTHDRPGPWEMPTPSAVDPKVQDRVVCGSLNERLMTQDKIGNQLGLATADFWSTCKISLVIYLTVPRIAQRGRNQ